MNKIIISFKTILLAVILLVGSVNAFGQATLPVNATFSAVTSTGPGTMPTGFSHTGLAGYAGSLKFDTQLDFLILNFTGTPGALSFDLGVNNTFPGTIPTTVTFTVQESDNGSSYTDVANYSNVAGGTKSISTLKSTTRYIKWIFTIKPSGTNLSLKNITLADGGTSSCTPLIAPTVTPTAGNTQATLSWGAVANASSYTLIWNGGTPETVTSPVTKTGLTNGTSYSYSVMAVGEGTTYCATNPTATGNVTPTAPAVGEPTNHATAFIAVANSGSQITLTWTDATGAIAPAGYLVKASTTTPTAPADGTPEVDAALVKNIAQGTQTAVFTGLSASTAYNFSIWPYSNSGAAIDYKIGSQPTTSTTTETPLGVPVATTASGISSTGFTANWDAAASATSYDVNVYTKTGGGGSAIETESFSGVTPSGNLIGSATYLTGWSVSSQSTSRQIYTTATNFGIASPSFAFTLTADYIETATYPSSITEFSFWAKQQNGATSSTLIEGYNGSVWITIATLSNADVATAGTKTFDLVTLGKTNIVKLKMTFTKVAGNLSIDDVKVTYGSSSSTPISGSPFTVSGATSKTLTGLTPETTYYYTVVAKKGAESSVASNEISATTSVSTALNNGKVGVPFITTAKGILTVNQLAANSTVRVYDATGRMLATKVSVNGSVQIPLQVAGVYTVRIAAGAKNWTLKVVNSNL